MKILTISVLLILAPLSVSAQTVHISLEPFLSGLSSPVFLTAVHDGTSRRFILEQGGRISVLAAGSTTRTTFLDITSRVLSGGEQGLLGLAFHPQFAANGRFFVDYTRKPDGATIIAEYHVSATDPDVADPTETVLIVIPQPYANHNGGMVEFGPDGGLYVGMGDGGSGNDPENHAQNPTDFLGKILRIDVDQAPNTPAIYALGLRNPWRFSFDRLTGQLYVGDVGQGEREEVDIVTAGGNYGWRVLEGTRCTNLGPASCSAPGFIPPIAEYSHATNGRCSITGGYVYRGVKQSLPNGAYIYGDYCSGEIFMYQSGVQTVLLDTTLNISSFGEDDTGELYVVDLGGTIYRITNPDPVTNPPGRFMLSERGSFTTESISAPAFETGYARVQADMGSALPSGMAMIGYRQAGILISEMSEPAAPLIASGRMDAYISGQASPVTGAWQGSLTGLAIANPNSGPVTVSFYFTDSEGNNSGEGSTVIDGGHQLAAFLNETPFNAPLNAACKCGVDGTMTFTSSSLVSVTAVRGFTNARGEFLMTTLPVADPADPPVGTQTIAHFAAGGEWTTELELVNPLDTELSGSVKAMDPAGQPIDDLSFAFTLPPRSSRRTVWGQDISVVSFPLRVGSVRITPASGDAAPLAAAIFEYHIGFVLTPGGPGAFLTVNQAAVAAVPGQTAFRMFVENLDAGNGTGPVQTGIGIANTTSSEATVLFQLYQMDGTFSGLTGTLVLPPNGQFASFLNQIPGLESLPVRFQGVLRVSSPSAIAVTGLRGHYNERGDFLISTTAAVSESDLARSTELLFPHFALGCGYETRFILFAGHSELAFGTMYLFDKNGNPIM